VTDFLEKFRDLAAVLVLLSVPVFVIFAVIPVLFCDELLKISWLVGCGVLDVFDDYDFHLAFSGDEF